ncbi:hypothetical protein OUZ56_012205 [Daphnia magna]|uniref:Uncharacterized protein n=1 Tax=Daphnia magna TaxID=35525 RepID=A0ABQ9Z2B7_9CRUS|nr:hypothetical protein OUZ56_012205 [Daphnia magna]
MKGWTIRCVDRHEPGCQRTTGTGDGGTTQPRTFPRGFCEGRSNIPITRGGLLSDSEWVVVTDVSIGPIENALNKLHLWFTDSAKKKESQAEKTKWSARLRAQMVERATDGLDLLGLVCERYDTLREAVAGGPRRAKRGIIDVGGTALHWLFGVATSQDLEGLNGQL